MGTPRTTRGGGVWRKRLAAATTVAFVAAAFLAGLGQPVLADDPLTEALKRKQDLERAVQLARANTQRYQTAASQYQAVVNDTNSKISDLAAKADAAQSEADQLFYEIQIAEEQLATREDLYARHLRTTYRQAMVSPLEMLLSSVSLTEFANRLQAMIFINRQDVQLANDIRALRADTQLKQNDAATKEREILGLQDQVTSTRKILTVQKDRYDKLVADANAAIDQQAGVRADAAQNRNSAQGQAAQSKGQTADLQNQLDQASARYEFLAAQAAGNSGLGAFTGAKLAMWPLSGPLTSPFGPRWGGFHNGIDIAAPMYTPIRAASAGKVVTVGRPYIAYGDTAVIVIVAHGFNLSTLYAHMDDRRWPIVQVGQTVSAGQILGYVGMTGFTTGPHLHFMTIANGRAVNPMIYLP